ncbi:SGNH/GDSL hydrolase family protein [Streptomyces sp. NPDC092296]|uniref:SGNH/GDSL hydrolase family protein n=1 Tax=Streptomyces sp. NPDC092296 TaxID=3366012 RepID=UPI00381F7B3E
MPTKDARTGAAAVLAAAALLLTAACSGGGAGGATPAAGTAAPAAAAGPSPRPPAGPYAALGDSYTSGPDIPRQHGTPVGCRRSSRDYPALVAAGLGLAAADFRDVSCTGATIADLGKAQSTTQGVNPAQLSALTARTRLVTLGIGGNDVGFTSVLTRCVQDGVLLSLGLGDQQGAAAGDAPCQAYWTSGGRDVLQERVAATGRRLAAALTEVRRRAPRARVFVVGYPALVPAGGPSCTAALGLAAGDVAFLHRAEQRLNAELRRRAEAAGAHYVDTWSPSLSHDACAAATVRWIEPLMPTAAAAPLHPNERGERGMADAVLRAVRAPA